MNTVSISAASWYPLSAEYAHDNNLNLFPVLIEWKDGYVGMYHPIFEQSKDISLNKQSFFCLTTAGSFFDFMQERSHAQAYLGSYVYFRRGNVFVTTIDNNLILSGSHLIQQNFFRVIVNSDNTVSFLQGESQYITVQAELPFNLYLTDLLPQSQIDRQKFNVYVKNTNIYITTKFANPNTGYGSDNIERFWSISHLTSAVRAIGVISDDDYRYSNNYIFDVGGFDVVFDVTGLTRDQTWVHYYNLLTDKTNNLNTEKFEARCISGVNVSRLVDLPYLDKITFNGETGTMKVNIANLKDIMTPEYEYNVRSVNFPLLDS